MAENGPDATLLLAALSDLRLTTDARCVVMHVIAKGAGDHEIPFSEMAAVLNHKSKPTVLKAIGIAIDMGWLVRRSGGGSAHATYSVATPNAACGQKSLPQTEAERNSGQKSLPQAHVSGQEILPQIAETDLSGGTIGGSMVNPSSSGSEASTTTTTTAPDPEDEKAEAVAEMQQDAIAAAKQIERGTKRTAFNAAIRGLVAGDDLTAWRDQNGDQVQWRDRPRLLRLAMDQYLAGKSRDVRSALAYFVVPQQLDPIEARRSTDQTERRPSTTASRDPGLPCSIEDLKTLIRHAGGGMVMVEFRPVKFAKLAREHPDLWGRAGEYFEQLDFVAIDAIQTQHKGFGLDANLREQLGRIGARRDAA